MKKKKVTNKYDKIFKNNPFAKKWKEKLLKKSVIVVTLKNANKLEQTNNYKSV
jgi:hypothetical protein